jgi:hypothetical protein
MAIEQVDIYSKQSRAHDKLTSYINTHLIDGDNVLLENINITEAYSFVSGIFLKENKKNLHYKINNFEDGKTNSEGYVNYLSLSFNDKAFSDSACYIVAKSKYIKRPEYLTNEYLVEYVNKIFIHPMKKFLFYIGNEQPENKFLDFSCKLLFGLKAKTLLHNYYQKLSYSLRRSNLSSQIFIQSN